MKNKNDDTKLNLCRCDKNPQAEPHQCPYACEINDDCDDGYCTCCEECEYECCMNI